MKRFFCWGLLFLMVVSFTACENQQEKEKSAVNDGNGRIVGNLDETKRPKIELEKSDPMETYQAEQEEENHMTMYIQIGDTVLAATLVQNSSTEALIEMLSEGPVTIEMDDYASMEKV